MFFVVRLPGWKKKETAFKVLASEPLTGYHLGFEARFPTSSVQAAPFASLEMLEPVRGLKKYVAVENTHILLADSNKFSFSRICFLLICLHLILKAFTSLVAKQNLLRND